jgi:hypothetical protein
MDAEDVKLALTDAVVPNNQCNSSTLEDVTQASLIMMFA